MSAVLLAIALAAAGAVIAAVFASGRGGPVGGLPRRPAEPDAGKRLQQRARDYIASGAMPRWD